MSSVISVGSKVSSSGQWKTSKT